MWGMWGNYTMSYRCHLLLSKGNYVNVCLPLIGQHSKTPFINEKPFGTPPPFGTPIAPGCSYPCLRQLTEHVISSRSHARASSASMRASSNKPSFTTLLHDYSSLLPFGVMYEVGWVYIPHRAPTIISKMLRI